MLYVLHGEDAYSRRQALEAIRTGLGPADALITNTTVLDGASVSVSQIKQACETVPFLSSHRLVIVEGLLERFEERNTDRRRGRKGGASADSAEWVPFAEYLPTVPPTTVAVLVDGELKRNPLLRALSKAAQAQEFRPLRFDALLGWIGERVAHQGGTIEPQAARLLAELVGPDLWQITQEIDKLLTFTRGDPVREADVQALVSNARDANVFSLVDAVMDRRSALALRLLEHLLGQGENPTRLLGMVARQARLVLLAQDLQARSVPAADMGRRLGIHSEYPLRKTLEQARAVPPRRAIVLLERLLETELAMKTGRLDEGAALHILVAESA
ncbi:MAG: DNA polymerase III subunit delta [Dehalococcoidia bacterium]|nr:DNA polymerase III subunit delta [Dehalococcoidia bacterium]